jgi:hypothetical protein
MQIEHRLTRLKPSILNLYYLHKIALYHRKFSVHNMERDSSSKTGKFKTKDKSHKTKVLVYKTKVKRKSENAFTLFFEQLNPVYF